MTRAESIYTSNIKAIARGGAIGLVGRLANQFILLVIAVVLSRIVGARVFGGFAILREMVNFTSIVGQVGLPRGSLRFASVELGKGNANTARELIKTATLVSLMVSSLAGLLMYRYSNELCSAMFGKVWLAPGLRVMSISLPFLAIGAVFSESIVAQKEVTYKIIGDVVRWLSFLVAIVMLCHCHSMGLLGTSYGYLFSSILFASVGLYGFKKYYDPSIAYRLKARQVGALLAFSLPLVLVTLTDYGLFRINILIGGRFLTDGDLGIYTAASRVAIIGALGLHIIGTIFSPIIAQYVERRELGILRETYVTATRWIHILTLPVLVVTLLKAESIMRVFGGSFETGANALRILCLGQFVNVSTGNVGQVLIMSGNQWYQVRINCLMIILNVAMCLVIVPSLGIDGLAISASVALGSTNLVRLRKVGKLYGITLIDRRLLRPLLTILLVMPLLFVRFENYIVELMFSAFIFMPTYLVGIGVFCAEEEDRIIIRSFSRSMPWSKKTKTNVRRVGGQASRK